MTAANKVAETPTAPPSATADSFEEEATSAASADQLDLPAEVTNELDGQYLSEQQIPAQDTTPESELDDLKMKNAALQEGIETLQRQNESLQENHERAQEQDKKWRKHFETFMHRATEVQRKDASKHQIRKGFKHLHKIVREGELQAV